MAAVADTWSIAGPIGGRIPARGSGSGCACRSLAGRGPRRVVAVSGQEVEWTGRSWRVDGQDRQLHPRVRFDGLAAARAGSRFPPTRSWSSPRTTASRLPPLGPLVLVRSDRIIGRAWAQYYPFWIDTFCKQSMLIVLGRRKPHRERMPALPVRSCRKRGPERLDARRFKRKKKRPQSRQSARRLISSKDSGRQRKR